MAPQPDLTTEFCGLTFPNPFVLPSAQSVRTREMIRRAFQAGWGGVVTQTLFPDANQIRNVRPRLHAYRVADQVAGIMNIELVTTRPFAAWLEDIQQLKEEFPERPLIASLMAPARQRAAWTAMARECEQAGADALELNLSCPHGMPELATGAYIGQDAALTAEVTRWVVEATQLPVLVKLTPNVTDIVAIARAAVEAGAAGLTAINNLKCLAGVDVEERVPLPAVAGYGTFGGYAGPGLKPIGLRCVAEIAQALPQVPIAATGGIGRWQDAVEYLLLGASLIQIYTVVMKRGFGVIDELTAGLKEYLQRQGFARPADLVGLVLPQIRPHQELPRNQGLVAQYDRTLCIRCGQCHVACRDSGFQAVAIAADGYPHIDEEACDGCGLCVTLCPVERCMSFRRRR